MLQPFGAVRLPEEEAKFPGQRPGDVPCFGYPNGQPFGRALHQHWPRSSVGIACTGYLACAGCDDGPHGRIGRRRGQGILRGGGRGVQVGETELGGWVGLRGLIIKMPLRQTFMRGAQDFRRPYIYMRGSRHFAPRT